ncbi:50S ribosomal protein L18 [Thermodesulfobacteriota bacterium]
MGSINRRESRQQRKKRVKKKTRGTSERPRLTVFRSSKHIYAQIVDDSTTNTLVESCSLSKDIKGKVPGKGGNIDGAKMIGEAIAKKALEKGIDSVVFDRNGFLYHGRIKALAESAREHGLKF